MTHTASHEDPLVELVRKAACAPLALVAETAGRLPSLLHDADKQLTMARSLGRVALRAAQTPRTSPVPAPTGAQHSSAAVPKYASLTAREIIALCREADPATLAWIRAAEAQGKARVTVLRAVDGRADADD